MLLTVAVTGFFNIGTVLLTTGCCTGTVTELVVGFDAACIFAGACT